MRLSAFILENLEPILQEWEDFARGIQPPHRSMDVAELRDHAKEMLEEIAAELGASSTGESTEGDRAAEIHAEARLKSGFNIDQLVSEYRALRASVLRLWFQREKTATWFEVEDMTRFNHALDRALSDSVARYSSMVRRSEDIFLGIVGHDLRTPLQYLSIGAEFLMRSTSDPQLIQLGSRMFDSTARMGHILNNLLDFTRSRTGSGMPISPQAADLAVISEQVADEFRFSDPSRVIVTEVSGDVTGRWDAARIGQVCQNLIGNALQHGDGEHSVTVRTLGDADGVRITVHNRGESIPESELAGIFDPLYRYAGKSTEGSDRKNMGLGLYIVREIVSAHGGRIDVHSTPNDGTTFEVWLPRNAPSRQGAQPAG